MNKRDKILICCGFLAVVFLTIFILVYVFNKNESNNLKNELKLEKEILSHYSELVKTNKESKLYIYDNGYKEFGIIAENEVIHLEKEVINSKVSKFHIKDFDGELYIDYENVDPVSSDKEFNERYKNYIYFNENIVTKNITKFYDDNNRLIYTINKSLSIPILIKYNDSYGIIYNNRLLKVKNEDVEKVVKTKNTDLIPTKKIAVLNYHFFYDESKQEEVEECSKSICHSISQVTSHINYIKENNILTLSMNEFEMWMDKRINLPKSVLITIDDGWRMQLGIDLFEKNKMNATVFLITSWFKNEIKFLHDYKYIEFHSHGDNLHTAKECPGGQGGAIKCWPKDKLLSDLILSRKKLEGSTAFCYPFYEYNDYSIQVLKEAGFTIAFKGGQKKSSQEDNKFEIPRYELFKKTTIEKFKEYVE